MSVKVYDAEASDKPVAPLTITRRAPGAHDVQIHLLVNAHGLSMRTGITPGQTSDYLGFDLVMADNLPRPSVLLANRGYDSDRIRDDMEARYVLPVIPTRQSRKKRIGWTARYIACATWSNAASTSSKMPGGLPHITTRPPKAFSGASTSRRSASGSGICQHDLSRRGWMPD